MIGLDTSALIDLFKNDSKIKSFLENTKDQISTTMVNTFEFYIGLDPENNKHQQEETCYLETLKTLYHFDITIQSCKYASRIFWRLKKQGKIISRFDCLIAAIFIANGVTKILTRNKKHFENIKELEIIEY